ncbi:YeiH family protein [Fulvivirga ligni]|uniref:YeiH family protein n=1 Tax=Fulvivirga ligni TaxID=2904246 RepID=UPI001F30FD51|nr:putative sulfate exporter family transporter [Fulvivirga ligni]UII21478.1 putative sulfate exporter family transporter [Fulvivirga ligni]
MNWNTAQKHRITAQLNHLLEKSISLREVIFLLAALLCLFPIISPPLALLIGIITVQFIGNPFLKLNHKATHILLQASVVGLGFSLNFSEALQAGASGFSFSIFSIAGTLLLGFILMKVLKIEKTTGYLIVIGTAICGGSAIAAVSPAIKAKENQISVALSNVFILNAAALFIFPFIGNTLSLSQQQFGMWSAIAIHDTSSVVGAAAKYGAEALEIATTVKLARALWIIPVTIISAIVFKSDKKKIKLPYFILLFIVAVIINSYSPWVQQYHNHIISISKTGFTLTLFLIGSSLSKKVLQQVGMRPLLMGTILWVTISATTLAAII